MKNRVDSQGKEYSISCAQSHQETQSSDTGVLQGSGRTPDMKRSRPEVQNKTKKLRITIF